MDSCGNVREEIESQAFINLVADCYRLLLYFLARILKLIQSLYSQLNNGTQIHDFIILAV